MADVKINVTTGGLDEAAAKFDALAKKVEGTKVEVAKAQAEVSSAKLTPGKDDDADAKRRLDELKARLAEEKAAMAQSARELRDIRSSMAKQASEQAAAEKAAAKEASDAARAESQAGIEALKALMLARAEAHRAYAKPLKVVMDAGVEKAAYVAPDSSGSAAHIAAQNEAMRETSRAMREQAAAAKESAKANAKEAEGMSLLEKQAKRAADAVERLALAKGKSREQAAVMSDAAFRLVQSGDSAPAEAVWAAKSALAAENTKKLGEAVADTARNTQGLAQAGRLLANAFLPDALVSRSLAGGRAIIGVLAGLSASALAVVSVVGVAAAGAFYKFRSAMKDSEEAGEKLNKTIAEQARRAEEAAQRHDGLRRDGIRIGEVAEAYDKVGGAADKYVLSLRHIADELDRTLAMERERIDLADAAEKTRIRAAYAPRIFAEADDSKRAILEAERDAELSAVSSSTGVARAEAESRAAAEKAKVAKLRADADKAAMDEAFSLQSAHRSKKDDLAGELRTKHLPALRQGEGALNESDPARQAKALEQLIARADEAIKKKAELDKFVADESDGLGLTKWWYSDEIAKASNQSAELGDPTAAKAKLEEYKALLDEQAAVEAKAKAAAETAHKNRQAAADASAHADFASKRVEIARTEASEVAPQEAAHRVSASKKAREAKLAAEAARREREEAKQEKAAAKGERQSDAETLGERAVRGVSSVNARDASGSDRTRREIAASAARVRAANDALHDADGATAKDLVELSAALREFADLLKRGPKSGLNAGIAELRREIDQLKSQLRESRN